MLPDHKKQFLQAVGFQADEIAAVEDVMAQKAKAAQGEGLRSKEQTIQPVVQPVVSPEPQPQQQPVEADARMKEAQEFLLKALEPILTPLTARLTNLEASVTAMSQQSTSMTPAASALAAKGIQQQPGNHVVVGRSPDGAPKENNSDKEAQANLGGTTGVPFLDNLLFLNQQAKNRVGG